MRIIWEDDMQLSNVSGYLWPWKPFSFTKAWRFPLRCVVLRIGCLPKKIEVGSEVKDKVYEVCKNIQREDSIQNKRLHAKN